MTFSHKICVHLYYFPKRFSQGANFFYRKGTQRTQREDFPALRSLRSFAVIIFGCGVSRASFICGFHSFIQPKVPDSG
jgi:hypothetical protein